MRVLLNLRDCPFGDDMASVGTCLRTKLYNPVRVLENLRVVVDENNGVTVIHKVVHHSGQPLYIGGMKADGGFVEDIQDSGGTVPDHTGKLHTLTFARGEGGGGSVEGEISET